MKSIGDQVRAFRESRGLNLTEMAREVQKYYPEGTVNRQKIKQLEDAGDRQPQYFAALAKAMGTTMEVLKAGEWTDGVGWAPKGVAPAVSNVSEAPSLGPSRLIPVVGHVKAGVDGYLEEMQYPVGHGEGYIEYWTRDEEAYALRIKGDSMHPRYRAGEFIVVTPRIEPQPGRDVVVKLKDGRKLLKQLNWIRGDELQLLSINDGYAPTTLGVEEIESIHRVAGGVPPDAFQEPRQH